MSNATEKEFIENEYHLSGIGGGFSVQFASSYVYDAAPGGARDACKRAAEKMKATLPKVAATRLYQAVLDAVRDRVRDAICIPHLPIDFRHTLTPSDRARTIRQKWKFSLQDALAHVLDVCSAEYDGALLAFSVRSAGAAQPDHMNMIYVAFGGDDGARATCHLFEPNGEQYARSSTDGMPRLERAWAAALQRRQDAAHDPQVRLCGGTGVQTALGTRSVQQVGSARVTTRRGYAVMRRRDVVDVRGVALQRLARRALHGLRGGAHRRAGGVGRRARHARREPPQLHHLDAQRCRSEVPGDRPQVLPGAGHA